MDLLYSFLLRKCNYNLIEFLLAEKLKTVKLQTLKCLLCGSELDSIKSNDRFECKKCGEIYDLRGISSMELNLEEFDRLLLFELKKKQMSKKRKIPKINFNRYF